MILRPVLADGRAPVDTAAPDAHARLEELYPRPAGAQSLRINVVATPEGALQGLDGSSGSLSNAADRAILAAIRSTSDAVLVGAESLRSEGYLLPRRTPLIVLTSTGDLSAATVDPNREHAPIVVLGPADAAPRVAATFRASHEFVEVPETPEVEGIPTLAQQLPILMTEIHLRGFPHVVCEGGPTTAAALFALGLVDELCLTTSPRPALEGSVRLTAAAEPPGELVQLLEDDEGFRYARYRLR